MHSSGRSAPLALAAFLVSGGFGLALPPQAAQAASYKDINCDCEIAADSSTCSCSENYTLCPFCTKEFRQRCTNENNSSDVTPVTGGITGRNKNTTCTVSVCCFGDYASQSCTNWSLTSRDTITIATECID